MNHLRICVMTAFLALGATVAAAPTVADPGHARLVAMCGTWDVEMTLWPRPGGPGLTVKATSTIRPLFDGVFVEEKIEGANGAPFDDGLDRLQHWTAQYEATRIKHDTAESPRLAARDVTKQFS